MSRYPKPSAPFVEAQTKGGKQRPSLIVLQSSFTTSRAGAALGLAHALHNVNAKESFHYIVDEAKIYRCVPDNLQAFFAEDSKHTIGIEVCDDPSGLPSRWEDQEHLDLLHNTAKLVAQLCLHHGIRPRLLNSNELRKWQKWRIKRRGGIVSYGFMAQAYWPEERFIDEVSHLIEKYKRSK